MIAAFLCLGGNIGDRLAFIRESKRLIVGTCGSIIQESAIYETKAWGNSNTPDYYNQCIELETKLEAEALLHEILAVERELGRIRTGVRNESRPIDIDILLFNDANIRTSECEIPHPRMHLRLFVLKPLSEIASGKIHPVLNKSINQLLSDCEDPLEVKKISEHVHLC